MNYSHAHSASSSSALATSSLKMKNPKLDKGPSRGGRKFKAGADGEEDDEGSKLRMCVFVFLIIDDPYI